MAQMTMKVINYNANAGVFEAMVDIQRGGRTYRYPCSVPGPLTMEPELVASRIVAQAERLSDTGSSLRSVL